MGRSVDRSKSNLVISPHCAHRTLVALFDCGFEPNERLEGLLEDFDGSEDLAAHVGYAPTQILMVAAEST